MTAGCDFWNVLCLVVLQRLEGAQRADIASLQWFFTMLENHKRTEPYQSDVHIQQTLTNIFSNLKYRCLLTLIVFSYTCESTCPYLADHYCLFLEIV